MACTTEGAEPKAQCRMADEYLMAFKGALSVAWYLCCTRPLASEDCGGAVRLAHILENFPGEFCCQSGSAEQQLRKLQPQRFSSGQKVTVFRARARRETSNALGALCLDLAIREVSISPEIYHPVSLCYTNNMPRIHLDTRVRIYVHAKDCQHRSG